MKINSIAPWFGSNRTLAKHVGDYLKGCSWVGIPYAGSMTELRFIGARTIMVNDKHELLINLAEVMAHPQLGPRLYRGLRRQLFHPSTLKDAQERCQILEPQEPALFGGAPELPPIDEWDDEQRLFVAHHYFVCVWMGRSSQAGTDGEFNGSLAVRYDSEGGDSAVRFQNAVASIPSWRKLLRRCSFSSVDALHFIGRMKDEPEIGIYCDPPFPDAGDKYKHKVTTEHHRKLATLLEGFRLSRVVCRFYDHPLIRELYSEDVWNWDFLKGGRDQRNAKNKPEVLLVKK